MYSVSRKNCAKIAAPIRSPLTFDAVSVRSLKICSGSSGAFERYSITKNEAISTADPARRPIVDAVPQPCWAARVRPYTSSIKPLVIDAAPARSKCRCSRLARLSRSRNGVRPITSRPTGTLMKKIHDQLRPLVSAPPSSTPAAPPLPDAAPQIPSATLRSRPSVNVVVRIDSAAGERSAAPRPCTDRNAISELSDHARPSSSELTVKMARPIETAACVRAGRPAARRA